jgi:hypothetical protein
LKLYNIRAKIQQKKWRVVFGAAAIRFLLFSTIDDEDD